MTYYLVYNQDSLVPYSISGQPHEHIDAGFLECEVNDQDGEDFVLFRKNISHFVVNVIDGQAQFLNRWNSAVVKKYLAPDNFIKDLNYNTVFMINFEIVFEQTDNEIKIKFDLPALSANKRNIFNTAVNSTNALCTMYITKFQDPMSLLKRVDFDLFELSRAGTITLISDIQEPVSIWAARKKQEI